MDSNLVVLELDILRKDNHQQLHQQWHRQQLRNLEDPLVLVQLVLVDLVALDHQVRRLRYSEEWLI